MNYQTYTPSADLSSLIKCFWTLESSTHVPGKQKIIPDGCMEMIFHYGDRYKQFMNETDFIVQPKCFVIGQITSPLEIEPVGITGIFSVRFHPAGFQPFSELPIKLFENKAIALTEIFGEEGRLLETTILTAKDTSERISNIEAFLRSRLADPATIDLIVKSTVDSILAINGTLSIQNLSGQLNINRKQLERKFSTAIGLSPKQLSKIIRLQAGLKSILNKNFTSLTALAYNSEYYDQAHFIKDFKEFTGSTPKQFYGPQFEITSLFYRED